MKEKTVTAKAIGYNKEVEKGREESTISADKLAIAQVFTKDTIASVIINPNGSGSVRINRYNKLGQDIELHFWKWGPE